MGLPVERITPAGKVVLSGGMQFPLETPPMPWAIMACLIRDQDRYMRDQAAEEARLAERAAERRRAA